MPKLLAPSYYDHESPEPSENSLLKKGKKKKKHKKSKLSREEIDHLYMNDAELMEAEAR